MFEISRMLSLYLFLFLSHSFFPSPFDHQTLDVHKYSSFFFLTKFLSYRTDKKNEAILQLSQAGQLFFSMYIPDEWLEHFLLSTFAYWLKHCLRDDTKKKRPNCSGSHLIGTYLLVQRSITAISPNIRIKIGKLLNVIESIDSSNRVEHIIYAQNYNKI